MKTRDYNFEIVEEEATLTAKSIKICGVLSAKAGLGSSLVFQHSVIPETQTLMLSPCGFTIRHG